MGNHIGLNDDYTKQITEHLNLLLASSQQFYINVRGYHWNVTGEHFFELHVKFEELYNELILQIDEIAERILTLGKTPLHTYADYAEISVIEQTKDVTGGKDCVKQILAGFDQLLGLERKILSAASEEGDEGTVDQMTGYISAQEKHVWMYSAFLGK